MNDLQSLEKQTADVVVNANQLTVTNALQFVNANEYLKAIKGIRKEVDNSFDPIIKKAHDTHKEAVAQKKNHTNPLDEAETIIKGKCIIYEELEKKRIETERLEVEKKAQALLAKADKMKNEGKADLLRAEASVIQSAPTTEATKAPGASFSTKWEGVVENSTDFLEYSLKTHSLRNFIEFDQSEINKFANSTKGQMKIPGIRFFEKTTMNVRS